MRVLKDIHATLIIMLVIPFLYALAEFHDADGAGMLYVKCLLIIFPIAATEIAVRRMKNLGAYLLLCFVVIAAMWAMMILFFDGSGSTYTVVMLVESIAVSWIRFRERIRLARQQREDDIYTALQISLLNQPSLGFLWYFAVLYAVGIIFHAKTLCDFAFFNAAVYFFIAFAHAWVTATDNYLGLNKRTRSIPKRRLYTISAAMAGAFAALVLAAMIPAFFLAGARRYTDIRTWSDNVEFVPYDISYQPQSGGNDLGGDDWIKMINEGEAPPEPSKFWTYLFWIFGSFCAGGVVYAAVKMIRQAFLEFRDSFDENGDRVEALDDALLQKEERLVFRRRIRPENEAERVRRIYKRTIRKYRKELPAPYESPAELEKNAGLDGDEAMKQLHVKYENVRYGRE